MHNFPIVYLNSNNGTGLLAFGNGHMIEATSEDSSYSSLQNFITKHTGEYIFGSLAYDLKNETEHLSSQNKDGLAFPSFFFWVPKYVVELKNEDFIFLKGEKCSESYDFLNYFLEEETDQNFHPNNFNFKAVISKEEYIEKVKILQQEIVLGNIYEINFCQEYYAENVDIKYPLDVYFKLNAITKAPFSSYFQFGDHSVYCGSPERFLKKTNNHLISSPIKGTSKRGTTFEEDEKLKHNLVNDPKERAENVMIVDLVRNDLSKIALAKSVKVDELCAIYSFKTVHQMISTISCEVSSETSFTDIMKATFPMASMTGVPKIRAMELIEKHESFKRGLYSGSIGYIKPNGDFDFNVVIRSLLYNRKNKYLSCSVGGAITHLSSPEQEYDECIVKVKKILDGINENE